MRKLFTLFLSLLSFNSYSQVKMNSGDISQLKDSIASVVRRNQITGLMVSIATKDSMLFSGGFGYADIETKRPVNNHTLFRVGSITKSIVALGILKLIESGKLKLNDRLKDIAPEVPFDNLWESSHPIQIINLLEHTTGFDDMKVNNMYSLEKENMNTRQMMMIQKNSMVCRWEPGERTSYSNVNYAILGYIITKITGQEYDKWLNRNVLLPAGMINSNFNQWSKFTNLDVKEYQLVDGQLTRIPSVTILIGPAMSMWSSADDMGKLIQIFLKNGKPILSNQSIEEMELPHSSLAAKNGLKSGYAMGNEQFDRFRGHEGAVGACSSSFRYNRELGIGFAISSNGNGLRQIENTITTYLTRYVKPSKIETLPLNVKAITPYLGLYQMENPRNEIISFLDRIMLLKVELINDTLCLNILGGKRKLIQSGKLTFTMKGSNTPTVIFAKDEHGQNIIVLNKRYYQQKGGFWAIAQRIAILTAALFALLTFPLAILGIIHAYRKKMDWTVLLMILPLLSVGGVALALISFAKVLAATHLLYLLRSVSTLSVCIFVGTLLFPVLSLGNLFILYTKRQLVVNRYLKMYLTLTALSLLVLDIILLTNGWIALRTWAM